jgi:hypothetical protein
VKDQEYLIRVGGFGAGDAGTGTLTLSSEPAFPPTLTLSSVPMLGGIQIGDILEVALVMTSVCPIEAAGFQAFLDYDPAVLDFLGGEYTPEPFGLPILAPISPTPTGEIDLSAGINQFMGQPPSADDAVLATLTFEVIQVPPGCTPGVIFRPHVPPTRLTTLGGDDIVPLALDIFPPPRGPGDANADGVVNTQDLVLVVLSWGACPPPPEFCFADLNCDGVVNVLDLVETVINWSP